MKKIIAFIALIVGLVSCNPNPTVVYTQPVTAGVPQYVQSGQQYQVITDPNSGAQQVVYTMNGLQYVIAYSTFMGWYNYGGYGYVNSMYRSSPTYFGTYNSNSYRNWRSSSFRDTYRGPARTYSSSTTKSSSFGNRSNTSNTSSSFGTRQTSRPSSSSSSSSFGSSRPSSRSSSFGSSRSSSRSSRH